MMSNLTVAGLASDTNYSCTAYNNAGTSENDTCEVTILKKGRKVMQQFLEIVKACLKNIDVNALPRSDAKWHFVCYCLFGFTYPLEICGPYIFLCQVSDLYKM